jgi:hypothetical protein
MRHVAFILALGFLPVVGSAHHSVIGIYSRDSVTVIEGEVSNIAWRNPHVLFTVTADDGQIWEVESAPPIELGRYGITRDLIQEGERYRVAGDPSRRVDNAIYATNILLPNGVEIVTYPDRATPRWSNTTLQRGGERVISASAARAAEERADGLFRVWAGNLNIEWDAKFTDAAIAARSGWDPSRDDGRLLCIPPGMVDAIVSPFPIELIEDGQDIVIRMEQWDGVRRIHMGDSIPSETVAHSPMGHSVGHWEGDTLVVFTNRIDWPFFDDLGTPQSEDVEIIERFSMTEDGQQMLWVATITDPAYLAEPAIVRQQYDWVPGVNVEIYNCTVAEPR